MVDNTEFYSPYEDLLGGYTGDSVEPSDTGEPSTFSSPYESLLGFDGTDDTTIQPQEDEWELRPFARMRESVVGFGSDLLNLSAIATNAIGNTFFEDTDKDERLRDWFSAKAADLAENNAELELQHTSFKEAIGDPSKLGRFLAEGVVSTIPDLIGVWATGGLSGAASASTRLGAKALQKVATKKFSEKVRQKAVKYAGKEGLDVSLEKAWKEASRDIGARMGAMGYMFNRGAGIGASQDVALRGVENAELAPAIGLGLAYAGLSWVSPVDMALAGKLGSAAGKRVLFTTPLKEGIQEMSEGVAEKLHLAGIDENRTVGDILTDPEVLWDLAGQGVIGAVVGAPVGAVEYGVNKPVVDRVPTDQEAEAIVENYIENGMGTPIPEASVLPERSILEGPDVKGMMPPEASLLEDREKKVAPKRDDVDDLISTMEGQLDAKGVTRLTAKAMEEYTPKSAIESAQAFATEEMTPAQLQLNEYFDAAQQRAEEITETFERGGKEIDRTDLPTGRTEGVPEIKWTKQDEKEWQNAIGKAIQWTKNKNIKAGLQTIADKLTPNSLKNVEIAEALTQLIVDTNNVDTANTLQGRVENIRKAEKTAATLVDAGEKGLLTEAGINLQEQVDAAAGTTIRPGETVGQVKMTETGPEIEARTDIGPAEIVEAQDLQQKIKEETGVDVTQEADITVDQIKAATKNDPVINALLDGDIKKTFQAMYEEKIPLGKMISHLTEKLKEVKNTKVPQTHSSLSNLMKTAKEANRIALQLEDKGFAKLSDADKAAIGIKGGKRGGLKKVEEAAEVKGVKKEGAELKKERKAATKKPKTEVQEWTDRLKRVNDLPSGATPAQVREAWGMRTLLASKKDAAVRAAKQLQVAKDEEALDKQIEATKEKRGTKKESKKIEELTKEDLGKLEEEAEEGLKESRESNKAKRESAIQQLAETDKKVKAKQLARAKRSQKAGVKLTKLEEKRLAEEEKDLAPATNVPKIGRPFPKSQFQAKDRADFVEKAKALRERRDYVNAKWDETQKLIPYGLNVKKKEYKDLELAHMQANKDMEDFISINRSLFDAIVRKHGAPTEEGSNYFTKVDTSGVQNAYDALVLSRDHGSGKNKIFAGLLLRNVSAEKLRSIPVSMEETGEKTSFYQDGKIFIHKQDRRTPRVFMHETIHGITVREMLRNPELKRQVTELMEHAKRVARNQGKLSKEAWKALNAAKGSSVDYHAAGVSTPNSSLAYAFINEKEFLAQALSSESVQDFLEGINAERGAWYTNIWDGLINIFRTALGWDANTSNALEKALKLTTDLATVDTEGTVDTSINSIFAGVNALGSNIGGTLDKAQGMQERGLSVDKIWKETGWIYSPLDEKWRFEIADNKAAFDERGMNSDISWSESNYKRDGKEDYAIRKLKDYMTEHGELYSAYPYLADTNIILDYIPNTEETRGRFYKAMYKPSTGSIRINLAAHQDATDVIESVIHETQHKIQEIENFDEGADYDNISEDEILASLKKNYDKIVSKLNEDTGISVLDDYIKGGLTKERALYEFLNELNTDYLVAKQLKVPFDSVKRITKDNKAAQEITRVVKDLNNFAYLSNQGEVEAREAEYRRLMSDDELTTPPDFMTQAQDVGLVPWGYTDVEHTTDYRKAQDLTRERRDLAPPKEVLSEEEKEAKFEAGLKHYQKYQASKKEGFFEYLGKISDMATESFRSITSILEDIHPNFATKLRKMEYKIKRRIAMRMKDSKDFIDGMRKLNKSNPEDFSRLMYHMLNSTEADLKKRKDLLKTHNLLGAYNKVRTVLDDHINRGAKEVGLDNYADITDYLPRIVKDPAKLIKEMKRDKKGIEDYGVMQAVVDDFLRTNGIKNPTEADRQQAISNYLKSGRFPAGLKMPSAAKQRKIQNVISKYMHHYAQPQEALIHHIYEMTEAVEMRKFIGASKRQTVINQLNRWNKELDKESTTQERRDEIESMMGPAQQYILDSTAELNDSISSFVDKLTTKSNLNSDQQEWIGKALRARMNAKGMNGPMADFRNIGLMTSLGGFGSTLTQLNDVVHSMHEYGIFNTLGSIFGNKLFTVEDMDIGFEMTEINAKSSAKWLDGILKLTQFKRIDGMMKGTTMQSAIKSARKLANQGWEPFNKKYGEKYGSDTEAIYNALRKDKLDKNDSALRFFAFAELSGIQPISMSELPINYSKMGNGRILYMLKTYNIKIANRIYDKAKRVWADPHSTKEERIKAAGDLTKYMILLVVAGASVDELKNWLAGDDEPLKDVVVDNMLKLFFMSRYTLDKGFSGGFMETLLKDVLFPPLDIIDAPGRDAYNWFVKKQGLSESHEFMKLVPLVGKKPLAGGSRWDILSSNRSSNKKYNKNKKYIIDELKKVDSVSEVRPRIREFNKQIREFNKSLTREERKLFKVSPIDAAAIKRARKAKREKERNRR